MDSARIEESWIKLQANRVPKCHEIVMVVFKKMPNNAVMPQRWVVLIVWPLFGDKQTSKLDKMVTKNGSAFYNWGFH